MSQDPALRAGDEDRDRTITRLREAYAEGRLSNDEFQQRMDQAQRSRTFGDLDALVADLPAPAAQVVPAPVAVPPVAVAVPGGDSHSIRNGWVSWLGVSILVNVIWLGTLLTGQGETPYYWPIWVMGPWGVAMLIRTLTQHDED